MKKRVKILLLSISTNAFALSIDQIYNHIKTIDNGAYAKYDNITYTSPTENILSNNKKWLLQTPNLWGHTLAEYNASKTYAGTGTFDPTFKLGTCVTDNDCGALSKCLVADFTLADSKLCQMPEHKILNNLAKNIESATYSVDIIQLGYGTPTTAEFTDTIKNALSKLAQRSISLDHEIDVRILEGSYIPFTMQKNISEQQNINQVQLSYERLRTYLKDLVNDLPANNKLKISVANMRSCEPGYCHNSGDITFDFAWNHGKFTNIDNNDLITGGQNYWGSDYFGDNPVNDSSIELIGPIANSATKYADVMWNYVNTNKGFTVNYCYTYANGKITQDCLVKINTSHNNSMLPAYSGTKVMAMSVAKLNHKVLADDADQSEIARVFAFKNAIKSIKISQQAIFTQGYGITKTPILSPVDTIDGNVIQALAYAIHTNNVNVSIITSNLNSSGYSSKVSLEYVYNAIKDSLLQQFPDTTKQEADTQLHTLLHLGSIDFNQSNDGSIKNHNKFWMVDDHIFYFGSHNIYPSALQQYGVIVDSSEAADKVNNNFWNPMWLNANKMK